MDSKIVLTFIGGDTRQHVAMDMAVKNGYRVKAMGFESLKNTDIELYKDSAQDIFDCHVLILPIPYKNKYGYINIVSSPQSVVLDKIMKHIQPGTLIILGKEDEDFRQQVKAAGIPYFDILKEESFSVLNAIPTAEGAIHRAMEKTDITLHGANVLVLGYGRIGKSLSRMLKGIGAKVTVEAGNRKIWPGYTIMAITESIWTNWMKFYQPNESYSIQFLILYLERLLR